MVFRSYGWTPSERMNCVGNRFLKKQSPPRRKEHEEESGRYRLIRKQMAWAFCLCFFGFDWLVYAPPWKYEALSGVLSMEAVF